MPDLSKHSNHPASGIQSYAFRYTDENEYKLLRLTSIGSLTTDTEKYRYDGLKRSREGSGFLFQYTLSGIGKLKLYGDHKEHIFDVPQHHAFLTSVPSPHIYYYDQEANNGKPWELLWIRFDGGNYDSNWKHMIQTFGPVVPLSPDSEPISHLQNLLLQVKEGQLKDKYDISSRLYEWNMQLLRELSPMTGDHTKYPDRLQAAVNFINNYYLHDMSLDHIATRLNINKHHLCKLFQRHIGDSPMTLVRKKRIEYAVHLLRNTNLPIQEIADTTRFDNASYFGKVFRLYIGMTPSQYRDSAADTASEIIRILN